METQSGAVQQKMRLFHQGAALDDDRTGYYVDLEDNLSSFLRIISNRFRLV